MISTYIRNLAFTNSLDLFSLSSPNGGEEHDGASGRALVMYVEKAT